MSQPPSAPVVWQLQPELWTSVLSYLPLPDLITCMRVSRTLQTGSLSPHIPRHTLTIRTPQQRNYLTYTLWTGAHTVRCLTGIVYWPWAVTDSDAELEVMFWKSLAVVNDHRLTEQPLHITSLQLDRNHGVLESPRAESWRWLLAVPNLEVLDAVGSNLLVHWPWSGSQAVNYQLWAHFNSTLQTLKLMLQDDLPAQGLINALPMLPRLRTLTISEHNLDTGMDHVTDYTPLARCSALRHLEIATMDAFMASELLPSIAQLSLHTLKLYGSHCTSNWPSWCEGSLPLHQTLTSLEVRLPGVLPDDTLSNLRCFQGLRSFGIERAEMSRADLRHIAAVSTLSELSINQYSLPFHLPPVPWVEMVTKHAEMCQRLTSLTLTTPDSSQLHLIQKACPNLQCFNDEPYTGDPQQMAEDLTKQRGW